VGIAKKYSFLLAFLIPLSLIPAILEKGIFFFSTIFLVFFLLPILDEIVGKDSENPHPEQEENLIQDSFFKALTMIWAFLQLPTLLYCVWFSVSHELQSWEWFLFAISVGIVGGVGINVAHELGHKNTELERFLSKYILLTVNYLHFYIEHNRGHHVHVSTPRDPATARLGESFYLFFPRVVWGSVKSAWEIATTTALKKGFSKISLQNEFISFILFQTFFMGIVGFGFHYVFGASFVMVISFLMIQSLVAIALLELVNYIEHYGLMRMEVSPGKYEKVMPIHSWNANHMLSNAFLFQLQRHSDHHANAGRRFQILRHFEESPQLPYGYQTMILFALVPPLWRNIMEPILVNWRENHTN
jgi:alkane 1-monooxygenase